MEYCESQKSIQLNRIENTSREATQWRARTFRAQFAMFEIYCVTKTLMSSNASVGPNTTTRSKLKIRSKFNENATQNACASFNALDPAAHLWNMNSDSIKLNNWNARPQQSLADDETIVGRSASAYRCVWRVCSPKLCVKNRKKSLQKCSHVYAMRVRVLDANERSNERRISCAPARETHTLWRVWVGAQAHQTRRWSSVRFSKQFNQNQLILISLLIYSWRLSQERISILTKAIAVTMCLFAIRTHFSYSFWCCVCHVDVAFAVHWVAASLFIQTQSLWIKFREFRSKMGQCRLSRCAIFRFVFVLFAFGDVPMTQIAY